ncbi:MAG: S8 family peptidase, partial [Alteraurantiacibacter sp.]
MIENGFRQARWRSGVAVAALALLSACGGGSSPPPITRAPPQPTPSPTPRPTPPAPTPTPTGATFPVQSVPTAFNTREFRDSDGPGQHNAASAWAAGNTGAGVTIGVIDTGIDPDSPEFAGRLSPASTDIYDTRNSLEGPDDHGTSVSLVAAAARNRTGILGIAYGASILAIRADAPGTCGGDNPEDPNSDCAFFDRDVARSIDYAVANGAKVVNISLGGPEQINATLRASVRAAVDAGVLLVVAAGNDGFPDLQPFGEDFAQSGDGGVLIVGSVDENYVISDFSNRAGDNQTYYLAARGERICCVYENGSIFVDGDGFVYLFSGTSFASPQVAGAAALLAQAFPNLTGREIAEILLESAFDAGAAGSDRVYGRGILDIAKAFQPSGATAIAGQSTTLALADSSAVGSPAMGDALTTASLPTLVTDRYRRAFEIDLAGTLRGAEQRQLLTGAVGQ